MPDLKRSLIILLMSASSVFAQDAESFLSETSETLSFEDSLSIFSMIDSLLTMDDLGSSQLVLRAGYNSNVLSAGRTLGIENFGLSPGISFYHRSGLYADLTGYWSNDFDPTYYLTVASVGYMHDFNKHFSVIGGYDHYFYSANNDDVYIPYTNTLSVTPIIDLKPFIFSFNYSFYFGDANAHRLMPGAGITFETRNKFGLSRIAITPSFYALWGDETIVEITYPDTWREIVRRIRAGQLWYDITEKRVFGIMNYTFSTPVSVSFKKWHVTFTYNYSIPKALPGEPDTFSESTFLAASISYYISIVPKKLRL